MNRPMPPVYTNLYDLTTRAVTGATLKICNGELSNRRYHRVYTKYDS